jgi:hypothetical protein
MAVNVRICYNAKTKLRFSDTHRENCGYNSKSLCESPFLLISLCNYSIEFDVKEVNGKSC